VGLLPDRIRATQARLGLSREEAARWVDRTDAERSRFVKDHFHKEPSDPRLYDLVLNVSRFTPAECATLIIAALRCLQSAQLAPQAESGRRGG
jgi:cytidylate kinase